MITAHRFLSIPPSCAPLAHAPLPLPHRLAIAYLALPLGVWLVGWLEWWIGVGAAALLIWALGDALRGRWLPPGGRWRWGMLLVALLWTLAAATFGADRGDWLGHAAVLLDLTRNGWPTYLVDHIDSDPPLLRYYLGYYMVPGLVGKWLGPAALNWIVPAWTWAGVALVLVLFVRGLSARRAVLVAAVVLVFFSGMDAVEYLLRVTLFDLRPPRSWEALYSDVLQSGFWFSPTQGSPMQLEYQSHAQTLGLTPQHFVTAALAMLLMVQLRRRARFLAVSGVVLTVCVFWSALLAIGLVPFFAALLLVNGPGPFVSRANVLVAPVLGGLVALYLTGGSVNFPSGWLWTLYASGGRLLADVAILYATEFLLLAALLWRLRPKVGRDPFFLTAVLVLLAAPWWWFGSAVFSELTVRVTLPALFLLSYLAARTLAASVVMAGRRGAARRPGRREGVAARIALGGLVCVLAAGGVSAASWHLGLLRSPGPLAYDEVAYSVLIDMYSEAAKQRMARKVSGLLAMVLRENEDAIRALKGDGRGELLFQSAARPYHEVYLKENRLLFVTRRSCRRVDREITRFLVRAHPAEPGARSRAARRHGPEVLDFFSRSITEHKGGHNCIWARRLPDYAVDRIVAAQRTQGNWRWMAMFRFADGRHVATEVLFDATAAPFEAEYAARTAAPPAARDRWNVHLGGGTVTYTKAPCVWADGNARFFLHVVPRAVADLPVRRRQHGFDNLDFRFAKSGVLFNGKCMVERELPDYPLLLLSTGQFETGGVALWRADIDLPPADGTRP